MLPKISVIIPTCNRPQLLAKAIKSVLAQTYADFELVVIDDGDIEPAAEIVDFFHDSRIKYIKHETRRGGGAARNTGIKNSVGEFVAFLDDDDEWVSDKLTKQMALFDKTDPKVGFCFCSVINCFNEDEKITKVPAGIADYSETALATLKGFLTVTLIIKRDVFQNIGYFDESLINHQESDLIIRITQKYQGLGINLPLVRVNMHDNRGSINADLNKRIFGREVIIKKHLALLSEKPWILARHYAKLSYMYEDNKDIINARKAMRKSLSVNFKIPYLLRYFKLFINI